MPWIARAAFAAALCAVSASCRSAAPVTGDWVGVVRSDFSWHPARLRIEGEAGAMRGTATVAGLGVRNQPVEVTLVDGGLQLRFSGAELPPTTFDVQAGRAVLRSDHTAWRGPAVSLVRPPALPDSALREFTGAYVAPAGDTVLVTPASDGGLRFYGLGRLSGTLLPTGGDGFAVARIDQATTLLHTRARFTRDDAGSVNGLEVGDGARRRGTALQRLGGSPIHQQMVRFRSGDVELSGMLLAPADTGVHPTVVFIHGTGYNTADRPYEVALARRFIARGVAVLLFDKRGCGASTGDWRTSSLADLAGDAAAAVRTARALPGVDARRVGVYGISEGGWVAPAVAQMEPGTAFIVNHGGPAVSPLEDELDDLTAGVARLGLSPADTAGAMELIRAWVELYRSHDALPRYRAALDAVRDRAWFAPFAARLPGSEDNWEVQWWRRRGTFDAASAWRARLVPSLVLVGERDDTMDVPKNVGLFREFARSGPRLDVRVVPGADHGLRVDGRLAPGFPDDVAAWIVEATSRE